MTMPTTLVVDDEPDIRELLEITLNRMDIKTICAEDINSARRLLEKNRFDLCLTDMRLPDGDGLDLLEHIQTLGVQTPCAVITAHGSMDTAVKAMKKGAFDFLSKPIDLTALRQLVSNALQLSTSQQKQRDRRTRDVLLGESELMRQIRSKIEKVARSQAPVYISGESGSGKELVARLIHRQSPKNENPFIAVNCGAIPHELMESEFFGHKKGSFTGAVSDKPGLFQAADGGTLFLDEVADLPLSLQVKLLRAIQEKKIRPVGEHNEVSVNVRLLSATHKDLAKMVQEGHFRQDLYYRLNVIELNLPPLRARSSDIPQITEFLLTKLAKANEMPQPKISKSALTALRNYYFPGNVRELENILERALALYDGNVIEQDDLNLPVGSDLAIVDGFNPGKQSLEEYLEDIEKQALTTALEENRWNKTATAKQLGLTFRSLRYRLKKLGLD
ncbi:sigma-54 dependent transcriptional regulator [Methylomarinum sp. Ch1-1]|uniref:Sigma-54 dependent transcriptional regulator n=1 Tax=Methylomarinum roseum TaxID=3067653 RepID=A0AAU7NVK5_9GAMM